VLSPALGAASLLSLIGPVQGHPPVYPLNCRGGAPLVFDTLAPRSDTGTVVRLAVTFAPSPVAAGTEGQGLRPGTCAWVDRPVNDAEPRRVFVAIHHSDSTPARTVSDTGMYWSFLAYDGGSGHLFVTGWWSGWRRLAGCYPDRDGGRGRAFSCGNMVMALANYRGGVRVKPDDSHLHFSTWMLYRPGHPPFSVPWSDINATLDSWPWFPWKGTPVVRLTIAGYPTLRILVPRTVGERIVAESGGRLQLIDQPAAVGGGAFTARGQPGREP
jgi:hypothetical protein